MKSKNLKLYPEAGTSGVNVSDGSDVLYQASFDISGTFFKYKHPIAKILTFKKIT